MFADDGEGGLFGLLCVGEDTLGEGPVPVFRFECSKDGVSVGYTDVGKLTDIGGLHSIYVGIEDDVLSTFLLLREGLPLASGVPCGDGVDGVVAHGLDVGYLLRLEGLEGDDGRDVGCHREGAELASHVLRGGSTIGGVISEGHVSFVSFEDKVDDGVCVFDILGVFDSEDIHGLPPFLCGADESSSVRVGPTVDSYSRYIFPCTCLGGVLLSGINITRFYL